MLARKKLINYNKIVRKTLIYRAFRTISGEGEGSRTPVRNPIRKSISGCSQCLEYSPSEVPIDREDGPVAS